MPINPPWWVASVGPREEADAVAERLGLSAHPEGGWYRETFRASAPAGARAAVSQIYFLLKPGERSRWHRLDADEIWHFYQGTALLLSSADGAGDLRTTVLGADLARGHQAHAVVPAGSWQAAEVQGEGWALVGCTVVPAFEFTGFEVAAVGWVPGRPVGN